MVRLAGVRLVVERGPDTVAVVPVRGSTLAELCAAAGCDLRAPFDAGHDTPAVGDPDEPIALDADAAGELFGWLDLGWRILDEVLATAASPSRIQLWPEHFDAGCNVATGAGEGERCNLGASPGDGAAGGPYLYVGPWGSRRPGGGGYWNAPFGATLEAAAVLAAGDPVAAGVEFLREGLDRLRR